MNPATRALGGAGNGNAAASAGPVAAITSTGCLPSAAKDGSMRSCGSTFSVPWVTCTIGSAHDSTSGHHDGRAVSFARGRVSSPTNTTCVARSDRGYSSSATPEAHTSSGEMKA